MSQFAGKTILVTGTSRGLGAALADALEAEAARVIRHTRAMGDLAGPAGIAAVAGQVPKLDILVHNAAINPAPDETIDELSPETLRAVFAVNVEAPIFLTTALLGPLRAARGQVLAVSSEAGMFSNGMGPTGLSYRASKAALNAFVLVAAQALAADGIRVNAVHPGWVRTDMGGDEAPLSPEDAARDVVAVLLRADKPTGRIFQAGVEADW